MCERAQVGKTYICVPGKSCEGCDLYPQSPPALSAKPSGVGARSTGRLSSECHSWREAWFLLIPRLDVSSWLCCLAPGEGRAEGGAKNSSEPESGRPGTAGRGHRQPPSPPQPPACPLFFHGASSSVRAAGIAALGGTGMVPEDSALARWGGGMLLWGRRVCILLLLPPDTPEGFSAPRVLNGSLVLVRVA